MRARMWSALWFAITEIIQINVMAAATSAAHRETLYRLVRHQGFFVLIGIHACVGFLVGAELIKGFPVPPRLHPSVIGAAAGALGLAASSLQLLYVSAGRSIIMLSPDDLPDVLSWLKIIGPATLAGGAVSGWIFHTLAGRYPAFFSRTADRELDRGADELQHVAALQAHSTGEPEWLIKNRLLASRKKVPPTLATSSLAPVPVCGLLGSFLRTKNEADFIGLGSWMPIYLGLIAGAILGLLLLAASKTADEDADTSRLLGLVLNWGVLISSIALPFILG